MALHSISKMNRSFPRARPDFGTFVAAAIGEPRCEIFVSETHRQLSRKSKPYVLRKFIYAFVDRSILRDRAWLTLSNGQILHFSWNINLFIELENGNRNFHVHHGSWSRIEKMVLENMFQRGDVITRLRRV